MPKSARSSNRNNGNSSFPLDEIAQAEQDKIKKAIDDNQERR